MKRGRKTIADKVKPVTTYVKESVIKGVGGMAKAKAIAKNALENGNK